VWPTPTEATLMCAAIRTSPTATEPARRGSTADILAGRVRSPRASDCERRRKGNRVNRRGLSQRSRRAFACFARRQPSHGRRRSSSEHPPAGRTRGRGRVSVWDQSRARSARRGRRRTHPRTSGSPSVHRVPLHVLVTSGGQEDVRPAVLALRKEGNARHAVQVRGQGGARQGFVTESL
jgi:hypothetical protein